MFSDRTNGCDHLHEMKEFSGMRNLFHRYIFMKSVFPYNCAQRKVNSPFSQEEREREKKTSSFDAWIIKFSASLNLQDIYIHLSASREKS